MDKRIWLVKGQGHKVGYAIIYVLLLFCGVAVGGSFSVCQGRTAGKAGQAIASKLIAYLNEQLPGTRFEADPSQARVHYHGDGYYCIAFENAHFTTDLVWMPTLLARGFGQSQGLVKAADFTQIARAVFQFDPVKEHLQKTTLIDMRINYVFENPIPSKIGIRLTKIRSMLGRFVSETLDHKSSIRPPGTFSREAKQQPVPEYSHTTLERIKFEVFGFLPGGRHMSLFLVIDRIDSVREGLEGPHILAYLFNKKAPRPDLAAYLQQGIAIIDVEVGIKRIKVNAFRDGMEWFSGVVEDVSYAQFIKPDPKRAFFQGGLEFGCGRVRFKIPGQNQIEGLTRVESFRCGLNNEQLTLDTVYALLEMSKQILAFRDMADAQSKHPVRFHFLKLKREFEKSNPRLLFFLGPLKHHYGEFKAEAKLTRQPDGRPLFVLTIHLTEVDHIIAKLVKDNIMGPDLGLVISNLLEVWGAKRRNGDAELAVEWQPGGAGGVRVNGRPFTFNRPKDYRWPK